MDDRSKYLQTFADARKRLSAGQFNAAYALFATCKTLNDESELDYPDTELTLDMATCLIGLGDLRNAINNLQTLLANPALTPPFLGSARFLMGKALCRAGNEREARKYLALALNEHGVEFFEQVGDAEEDRLYELASSGDN